MLLIGIYTKLLQEILKNFHLRNLWNLWNPNNKAIYYKSIDKEKRVFLIFKAKVEEIWVQKVVKFFEQNEKAKKSFEANRVELRKVELHKERVGKAKENLISSHSRKLFRTEKESMKSSL